MLKRIFLVLLLVVVMAVPLFASGSGEKKPATLTKMTFITPRGTLEVMDDYNLWVAKEMGYFEELGIDCVMEPGPDEAKANSPGRFFAKAMSSLTVFAGSEGCAANVKEPWAREVTGAKSRAMSKPSLG